MPAEGFTIETRAGRLIEARVFGLRTREDADSYATALGAQVLRMTSHAPPILCADHRPVFIYPQAAAARLAELFTQMNAQLERVAILAARSNATLVLQLDRLVREAAYPSRRVFYTPEDAQAHLAPVLDTGELRRFRAFLEEYPPRSSRAT
jgi:hypothetical protein